MAYLDYLNESVRNPRQELEDLKRANGFTDADLVANRMGRIAAGQCGALIRGALRPLARSFLVFAGWSLLLLVAGWVISAGLHLDARIRKPSGLALFERFFLFRGLYVATFVRLFAIFMAISCAGGLILAVLSASVRIVSLICDLLQGSAVSAEGRVYAAEEECPGSAWDALRDQWTRVRQERRKMYRYAIRDLALNVSYAGFRAIASGEHYKLYYTPRSKLLLSIEPGNRPPVCVN